MITDNLCDWYKFDIESYEDSINGNSKNNRFNRVKLTNSN